ncbi:MAG TPA: cytochrome c peroxidase [Levilinea sp.]|nr:cytochrome c peroxidase [Levilinea sp.]
MEKKPRWDWIGILIPLLILLAAASGGAGAQDTENVGLVALGKALFFDPNLSVNGTQSCAACHGPEAGFTGPDALVNATTVVYLGALEDRFGGRKPPASAYAGHSPVLYYDEENEEWAGGMFWDGRATGWTYGDPLMEQAMGPFLNPLEQAMPNARLLCQRVSKADYAVEFLAIWGPDALNCAKDAQGAYERIGASVAAYERSHEVNPYSSKFDLFWDTAIAAGKDVTKIKWSGMGGGGMGGGGMGGGGSTDPHRWQNYRGLGLTDQELQGLAAFNDPNRADCAACHSLEPGPDGYPLFTDFRYDNIGMPKNPDNPFYTMPQKWNPDGLEWVDKGLGGYLMNAGYAPEVYEPELGKFKVPTLRNVDLRPSPDFVKAYGHNGYFKSLEELVHFYAWRGMMTSGCGGMGGGGMGGGGMCGGMGMELFPPPEVELNAATMKHFGMMDQANIVAFLKTLSDGYFER